MASFFLSDGTNQYQCEQIENDLCLLNTFNGQSYIYPNVGHLLWYYDEYHNKYWRYMISKIIKIIDSRIICKILFSDNCQRIYAYMRDDFTPTEPIWILRGNLIIDPILEYGICNIIGPELESIYVIVIKSFRKSIDNESLYYIRQPDENERQALLHGEIFAVISVFVDNFFRKDVYDRWKCSLETSLEYSELAVLPTSVSNSDVDTTINTDVDANINLDVDTTINTYIDPDFPKEVIVGEVIVCEVIVDEVIVGEVIDNKH